MAVEWTKETLQALVNESDNMRQVLIKSGRVPTGNSYQILRRAIEKFNIDISIWDRKSKNVATYKGGPTEKYTLEELFKKDSPVTQKTLRSYVERHSVVEYRCAFCGCDGHWLNGIIALDLDHINGDNTDNRVENLRYLCPNCHAITDTYRGKNKNKHRA